MCRKKRYRDRVSALLALSRIDRGRAEKQECRAYRCPKCRYWHLTSMPKWPRRR